MTGIKKSGGSALRHKGLERQLARAVELVERRLAPSTRRAYACDLAAFEAWAEAHGVASSLPVPVPVCAAWLAACELEGRALNTIRRRARGLAHAHREAGVESPTDHPRIKQLLAGIAKTRADAGERPRKKRALSTSMLRVALLELSTRDRALGLVAIVTGLRRSELVALTWGDLEPTGEGMIAWVRRSKTDQAGEGRPVVIPRGRKHGCPVRALGELRRLRERDGKACSADRVFGCRERTVARVVQRIASYAGEDPAQFGAHSARAGLLTTASEADVDLASIMRQSGHSSTSVAMGYIRPAEQARNPAARAVVDKLGEDT